MRTYFQKRHDQIEKALKGYLYKYCDRKNVLFSVMDYATFPAGKRIRPLLCIEACIACGGTAREAMPAACAVEFIHNFSLVHDDLPCMDNDDYRRGKPSCHRKFGEAKAVLAGDALLSTAFEILTDIKDPGSMKEAVAIISRASGLSGIMGGQGLDIMYINKKKSRDLAQRINALKTGALFIAAVKTGAALSGASAKRVKAVEKFGKIFGDSFQLRDDIIDKVYKGTASGIMKNKLSGMISGAKRTLDIFGKKADNLKKIADLLILEQDSEK